MPWVRSLVRILRLLHFLVVPILFIFARTFLIRRFTWLGSLLSLVVRWSLLWFLSIGLLVRFEEGCVWSWVAWELFYLTTSIEIVIHDNSCWCYLCFTLRCLNTDRWFCLHGRLDASPFCKGRERSFNGSDCALIDFSRFRSCIALVSLTGSRLWFGHLDLNRFLRYRFSRFFNSLVLKLIYSFGILQPLRYLELNLIVFDFFGLLSLWSRTIQNLLWLFYWWRGLFSWFLLEMRFIFYSKNVICFLYFDRIDF